MSRGSRVGVVAAACVIAALVPASAAMAGPQQGSLANGGGESDTTFLNCETAVGEGQLPIGS